MKFLHTADLHLGRVFHERSLIEDQRVVLDALIDALAADDYAALVLSGDIYDRSIPSQEAVSLFGSFLGTVRRRFPNLAVFMVPGNHDSADRLGYADRLFAELDIHIVVDAELSFSPVVVERAGERCAFFLLPFLTAGALRAEETSGELGRGEAAAGDPEVVPLRSQRDLAILAAERLERGRVAARDDSADATVLVAHLFAVGGRESESERAFLGTAERVEASLFSGFDYVALGHLHRCQSVTPNAWYSGSPLAYSFDEAGQEKAFLSVGVGRDALVDGEVSVTPIPIHPMRELRRLRGPFDSFLALDAYSDARDAYLEISLSDARLTENPLALLRQRFPHLLSIKQDEALASFCREGSGSARRDLVEGAVDRRGAVDDFVAFLADLYESVDDAEVSLFRVLAKEAEDETP